MNTSYGFSNVFAYAGASALVTSVQFAKPVSVKSITISAYFDDGAGNLSSVDLVYNFSVVDQTTSGQRIAMMVPRDILDFGYSVVNNKDGFRMFVPKESLTPVPVDILIEPGMYFSLGVDLIDTTLVGTVNVFGLINMDVPESFPQGFYPIPFGK